MNRIITLVALLLMVPVSLNGMRHHKGRPGISHHRGGHKGKGRGTCPTGMCKRQLNPLQIQGVIFKQFLHLQKQAGISLHVATMKPRVVVGQTATQIDFNKVRSELNNLLKEEALSDDDIKKIEEKINHLDALKPARWPRAEDYRALLKAKIAQQEPLLSNLRELLRSLNTLAQLLAA